MCRKREKRAHALKVLGGREEANESSEITD